jgi:peptidoglycan-N-acetylglucosamine deacetylase
MGTVPNPAEGLKPFLFSPERGGRNLAQHGTGARIKRAKVECWVRLENDSRERGRLQMEGKKAAAFADPRVCRPAEISSSHGLSAREVRTPPRGCVWLARTLVACENSPEIMSALPVLLAAGAGVAAAAGTFAWGAAAPQAQLFGRTLRVTGSDSSVALTFDDGPNPAVTPRLLDLLARHHVRATFFLIGKHVRAFPDIAKQIAAVGHAIGNHTETHPNLTFLSTNAIHSELHRCDGAITNAIGNPPRWMRPPYGFRGPHLDRVVRHHGGAGVVMWSVSAHDWVPNQAAVIERLRRVRGGDIVLLHDADHKVLEGDRLHTVAALEHWLPRWRDAGLRFVSIDEVAAQRQV